MKDGRQMREGDACIGSVNVPGRIALAPMAGVSDVAYRLLAKEQGAALVCTEMVSAMGIRYANEHTKDLLYIEPSEHPVSMQIFGSDPSAMAEGAKVVSAAGADIVDINMGCPVKKIVSSGDGSALMKTPDLAVRVAEAAVKAVDVPVTVKLRLGWDEKTKNVVGLAKALEGVGVSAVTVHARTREQMYAGKADWSYIAAVKAAVKIPVWGNGDVTSPETAKAMFEETGCDGICIGRGAQGNPWIFRRISHYLETGTLLPSPSFEEILKMLRLHFSLLLYYKGEHIAVREIRTHAGWYLKGLPGAAKWRNLINTTTGADAFRDVLARFEEELRR